MAMYKIILVLFVFVLFGNNSVFGLKRIKDFFKGNSSTNISADKKVEEKKQRRRDAEQGLEDALPWYSSGSAKKSKPDEQEKMSSKAAPAQVQQAVSKPSRAPTAEEIAAWDKKHATDEGAVGQKMRDLPSSDPTTKRFVTTSGEIVEEHVAPFKAVEKPSDRRTGLSKGVTIGQERMSEIEFKQLRIQELGAKIQDERKQQADMPAEEKVQSKKMVEGYAKQISGLHKGIKEVQETERLAALPIEQHKQEVAALKQKAQAAEVQYVDVKEEIAKTEKKQSIAEEHGKKGSIEVEEVGLTKKRQALQEELPSAKKDFQRSYAKAKLAEVRLQDRLEASTDEPVVKAKTTKKMSFGGVEESTASLPKKQYDPSAMPARGILKKP